MSIQNCRNASGTAVATGCAAFNGATPDRNVPSTTRYDALGRAYETVDALGHVTRTTYDGLGRAVATTQNDVASAPTTAITNVTTLIAYNALGQTTVLTDGVGVPRPMTGWAGRDPLILPIA
jgi:YD repeat-containing protein